MKAPAAPFWSLLKHELTHGYFGAPAQGVPTLLAYCFGIGALPLFVLFANNSAQGNIATLFEAGFLPIINVMFLGFLTIWVTYTSVPAFSDLLAPGTSVPGAVNGAALEFLFTRAVNRRVLFRARSTVFLLVGLTPFCFCLVSSPFMPQVRFAPVDSVSPEGVHRQARYLETFSAAHPALAAGLSSQSDHLSGRPGPPALIIPHGAIAYSGWLAWTAALGFVLLQGYATLIAKRVRAGQWWTLVFPAAPILFQLLWLALGPGGSLKAQVRLYEESFLLFSRHPLMSLLALITVAAAIQAWCERRFSRLEID